MRRAQLFLLVGVALFPFVQPVSHLGRAVGGETGLRGLDPRTVSDSRPVAFVPNLGQWEHDFQFTAAAGPIQATFGSTGLLLDVLAGRSGATRTSAVAGWVFEEGNVSAPVGVGLLPGYHNYFIGADPIRWRNHVPLYAGLRYEQVWPGVDIVIGELDGHLEYDVVLAPGADLEQVVVACEGVDELFIEPDGTLVMDMAMATIRQKAPRTWQVAANGTREEIACTYRVLDGHRFGFEAPDRNPGLLLVIDPGPEAGGIIGEGRADDRINSSTCRTVSSLLSAGATEHILVGTTGDATFATTPGAFQHEDGYGGGLTDAFVTVMNEDFSALVWSTFLGGPHADVAWDVGVHDASGDIFVTGETVGANQDWPGAFINIPADGVLGGQDIFLARIRNDGAVLKGSYLVGGEGDDRSLAMDIEGDIVALAGSTTSLNWGAGGVSSQQPGGGSDALVVFLSVSPFSGVEPVWAFLGGSDNDTAYDLVTAPGEEGGYPVAYLVGETSSQDFPVAPALPGGMVLQAQYGGGETDGFIGRVVPTLASGTLGVEVAATFFGGGDTDALLGLDHAFVSGTLAIGGHTRSSDISTGPDLAGTEIVFQKNHEAYTDGLVGFVREDLTAIDHVSYLGGKSDEQVTAVALLKEQTPMLARAVVVGTVMEGALGPGGPVLGGPFLTRPGAHQGTYQGGASDAFVSLVTLVKGKRLLLDYSSYLGGPGADQASSVVICPGGHPVVVGTTDSEIIPDLTDLSANDIAGSSVGFVFQYQPKPTHHEEGAFFTYGAGTWQEGGAVPTLYGESIKKGEDGAVTPLDGEAGKESRIASVVRLKLTDGTIPGSVGFLHWGVYGSDHLDMAGCGTSYVQPPFGWTMFSGSSGDQATFLFHIPQQDRESNQPLLGLEISWQAFLFTGQGQGDPCGGNLVSNGLLQVIGPPHWSPH